MKTSNSTPTVFSAGFQPEFTPPASSKTCGARFSVQRRTSVRRSEPLGLRFLRGFRRARAVEGNRPPNERLEGGGVNFFPLVDVDRAACVPLKTRVEKSGRIL